MENNSVLLMNNPVIENSGSMKFLQDVLKGLSSSPKYLESKYFYDEAGDKIFQQIMGCPEYYPTRCELEILSGQTSSILHPILARHSSFDLVELGAGDALKSAFLLKYLSERKVDFTYYPIDISANVIDSLTATLPEQISGLTVHGLHGDYFDMLQKANAISSKPKLILFLGSNIGNMFPDEALRFSMKLKENLQRGDLLLIGFDLKKDPRTILNAYNDPRGFTSNFNLNLLTRINRELDGNFDLNAFQHYPTYNPETGSCESFLVSLKQQKVTIADQVFCFDAFECIHTEISQKYTVAQTNNLAEAADFTPLQYFYDSNRWFLDVIWER
jgi:L-histidine N-alpha-methyltransferase